MPYRPRRKRAAFLSKAVPSALPAQINFASVLFGPNPTMQIFSGERGGIETSGGAKQNKQKPQPAKLNPARRSRAGRATASKVQEAAAVAVTVAAAAIPSPVPPLASLASFVPVYGVQLVQTGQIPWNKRAIVSSPRALVDLMETHLIGVDREHFALVLLDIKNRLIGVHAVSVGDLCSSLAHPREVFKPALLSNAASVLLFHNHPSGSPEPSPEDIAITKRLGEAGSLIGVCVLDHVILGGEGRWVSMKQAGLYDADGAWSPNVTNSNGSGMGTSDVFVRSVFGGPTFIGDSRFVDMRDMGNPGRCPTP